MSKLPRTIVEFIDTTSGDTPIAHKSREIRINGTPVLIEAESVHLEFAQNGGSDFEVTKVTMTLLPTEIHFSHYSEGA